MNLLTIILFSESANSARVFRRRKQILFSNLSKNSRFRVDFFRNGQNKRWTWRRRRRRKRRRRRGSGKRDREKRLKKVSNSTHQHLSARKSSLKCGTFSQIGNWCECGTLSVREREKERLCYSFPIQIDKCVTNYCQHRYWPTDWIAQRKNIANSSFTNVIT